MKKLNGDNLKIALQRKGRLAEPSLQLLKSVGMDFDYHEGKLFAPCRSFPLDLLFLRDDDIPEYVQDGVTDLGIAGLNIVQERGAAVAQLDCLEFGSCSLSIAVPRKGPFKTVFDLEGKRIATSHAAILARFLDEKGVRAKIIPISGSVEIAPSLDVADAICDLVSTGSTLRMNDLEPIELVLKSEAVLIANPSSLKDPRKKQLIDRLRIRFQGNIRARKTKYVMMNAPESALAQIRQILPGMKSPTIVQLAEPGMIAVHAAVPEEFFWDVIEKLKQAGASDILVVPVEKMVV
ncbi:MAG: ATP phosphoribosyltransferase [Acidobacteria bacterium]|nr:MAG: ATP phosphoribosyltransferase [Acidobacteriota bacterium]